jgi:hypothetical protein
VWRERGGGEREREKERRRKERRKKHVCASFEKLVTSKTITVVTQARVLQRSTISARVKTTEHEEREKKGRKARRRKKEEKGSCEKHSVMLKAAAQPRTNGRPRQAE